jgi:cation transporter-like permease
MQQALYKLFFLVVLALSSVASTVSLRRSSPFFLRKEKAALISMGKKIGKAVVQHEVDEESAVLRELKETVTKQSKELDSLRAQVRQAPGSSSAVVVAKRPASSSSSHHHGAPSNDSEDELHAYVNRPFYSLAFKRVGWLSFFLASLSLTALIMNGFEHTLSRQLELAYFVPLLAGHGGNTGGQTVGTVLSGLSAGTIQPQDALRVITKEALSGLMVGTILGAMVGPVAHFGMGISYHVSTVILCTLPLVSTIAATLGSAIPFACVALGLDPSVIAAPAMTSFVDVTGLMSYFLIANKVFHLFGLEL